MCDLCIEVVTVDWAIIGVHVLVDVSACFLVIMNFIFTCTMCCATILVSYIACVLHV